MVALRPGISIVSRAAPTPRGIPTDTGTWFVVGSAQKGSTTVPQLLRSMGDYTKYFGARSIGSTVHILYDALETFFREGGSQAYAIRVEGASSAAASSTLLDGSSGNSLKVTAKNVGLWGNNLTRQVVAGVTAGTFVIIIANSGVEVDRSPELADVTAAYAWTSDWVTVSAPTSPSGLDPAVVAATALTGGADDQAGINDTLRQTALTHFTADLGPGQVSIPGNVTPANRTALIAHARNNNRYAVLDATDTSIKATLVTEGQGLTVDGNEWGDFASGWVKIPGITEPKQPRTVPPSAYEAAMLARNDAVNGTASPAAGIKAIAKYVIGLSQPGFTDADASDLNDAGINLIRSIGGRIQLYGNRTLGLTNGPWSGRSVQRTRMALVADLQSVARDFVFEILDGKGHTISDFAGRLTAVCERYRTDKALYGDTPEEAYGVDVGPAVNTPETIANNELRAIVQVRISGYAELVTIEIVKVATNQTLAA